MYKYAAKPITVGKKAIFLPECQSTNQIAALWAKQGILPHGGTVICHRQTHGKGQQGNHWVSEAGKNLTFSFVLLNENAVSENIFALNFAVSLALYQLVSDLGFENASIKWPNDLYIGNRKVAGILIENSLQGNYISQSIMGIGLNVNQEDFGKLQTATSLKLEANKEFPLEVVFRQLLERLNESYQMLKEKNFRLLKERYLQHLLGLGAWREFEQPDGKKLKGKIVDVDPFGRLVLLDEKKHRHFFGVKEIRFLF